MLIQTRRLEDAGDRRDRRPDGEELWDLGCGVEEVVLGIEVF